MKSGIFKRTAIVASLATLGFAAHAEGFYFYALVDGGIANTKVTGGTANLGTTTEFITGGYAPTFAGIKGEKSMDGVTGGFQLEQGFLLNPSSSTSNWGYGATNSLFNRQANLFVSGNFGKVTIGTQSNIAFDSVLKVDPRAGSNFGSGLAAVSADGPLSTVDVGAISYTSPTVSNVTAGFSFVPDTIAGTNGTSNGSNNSGARAAVTYGVKGLTLTAATFENHSNGLQTQKGTVAGGAYTLGDATLKALYASEVSPTFTGLRTTGVGGSYAINAKTVLDLGSYTTTDSATSYKMNTLGLGVQYEMFKGLKAYGQVASVKNASGAATPAYKGNYDFVSYVPNQYGNGNSGLAQTAPGSIATGQTAQTINIGLLYAFF